MSRVNAYTAVRNVDKEGQRQQGVGKVLLLAQLLLYWYAYMIYM